MWQRRGRVYAYYPPVPAAGNIFDLWISDIKQKLEPSPSNLLQVMVFALDNADAAGDVVEVLAESLTLKETPAAVKLARLFAVNDILHNSTAPVRNASRYRGKLEPVLPDIFESFQVGVVGVSETC